MQSILKSIQQKVSLLEAFGITCLAVMNPNPNYTHIILSFWSKTPFDVLRIDSYFFKFEGKCIHCLITKEWQPSLERAVLHSLLKGPIANQRYSSSQGSTLKR